MRSLPLCLLSLLLLLGADRAVADDSSPTYKALKSKEDVHKALIDCRSLTVAHETRVELQTAYVTCGHSLTFDVRSNGKFTVVLTKDGEEAEGRPKLIGDKPGILDIPAFDLDYGLTWRPDEAGDAVWIGSAYGAQLKTKGGVVYVVDSNRNGVLGETLKDGIVVSGTRTVAPFGGQVWTRDAAYHVRRRDGGWEAAPYADTLPKDENVQAALRLLNWRRQQCGVLPVAYVPAFEEGMLRHLVYCVHNMHRGGDEDPEKKGYSKLGAKAGPQCVLAFTNDSAVEAMERMLGTAYQRSRILSPGLAATALTFVAGAFAVNVEAMVGGPLKRTLAVYPAHGMEDVPVGFAEKGEIPMPTLDQPSLHDLGTAVAAYAPLLEALTEMERPTLTVSQMKKGDEVLTYRRDLKHPGRVPHEKVAANNFGVIVMVPPGPLEPKTTYRCTLEFVPPADLLTATPRTADGKVRYVWTFETGR